MVLTDRYDGGNDVGHLDGEQILKIVVGPLNAVAFGEFVSTLLRPIDKADDFTVRMTSEGSRVVAAPGACRTDHGHSVFLFWHCCVSSLFTRAW